MINCTIVDVMEEKNEECLDNDVSLQICQCVLNALKLFKVDYGIFFFYVLTLKHCANVLEVMDVVYYVKKKNV